jgi:hypothetical protein
MSESDRATSLSKARTLDEIADFWDPHSLADYGDQTREDELPARQAARYPTA